MLDWRVNLEEAVKVANFRLSQTWQAKLTHQKAHSTLIKRQNSKNKDSCKWMTFRFGVLVLQSHPSLSLTSNHITTTSIFWAGTLFLFSFLQIFVCTLKLHSFLNYYKITSTYLIFVTNPTNISVEKKIIMWRNFRFLCMTNVEISEIFPHGGQFQISPHDRCGEI